MQGGCSCGSVRLAVEGGFEYAFYCHCSRCRRRTGSAFAAIGGVAIEQVRITRGAEQIVKVGESSESYACVCRRCHSPLYSAVREQRFAHVALGVLDTAPDKKPDHHIHVASKAPWYTINDGLPQYDELPP